ncbi:MFS transporter [Chloroflexota bacterium]
MLAGLFKPRPTISDEEVATGLRWLTLEGMASLGLFSITTSGFLAAYALILGASNLQIGILAAIPFLTQPLQIAAIPLVERIRQRKLIAIAAYLPAQLLWIPIALIPVFLEIPNSAAISLLLGLMATRGIMNAITNCAWNSWIRDLVPQELLGRVFARRLALSTMAAMVFGLLAAFFVDYWQDHASPGSEPLGYTYALLFGAVFLGLASPLFMSRMPEPLMQPLTGPKPSLISGLATPFRDPNYKHLLRFLFFWGMAVNLATPFFAVYMLQRLGLPLTAVLGFTVLSQATNIAFVQVWGNLADRFGNKAVLSLCVSLYLLVILGWTFTTMPDRYFMTLPLLAILHILAGIAAAGVSLTTGTIGLKVAPKGQATSYLAGAALAISLGSGLSPLLGGYLADFFSVREFGINFTWIDPGRSISLTTLNFDGFDFLFAIAFILGLMTLPMLAAVREEGEVSKEVVLESLYAPMRSLSRPMSSVPLFNFLGHFPFGQLIRLRFPGVDVAMGVTGYQIASLARAATVSAAQGRKAIDRIAKPLEESLLRYWKASSGTQEQGPQVARQAARGAMHATKDISMDMGQVAHDIMLAVVGSLQQVKVDLHDSISGAAYGIVRGAGEVGSDIGEAAVQAVEAAREAARDAGLSEDLAASDAAKGALQAAVTLGPEVRARVAKLLPYELLQMHLDQSEPEADSGEEADPDH